mmetsp:Transcript_46347/g.91789  ORF Transcript_46347/g.91789 Transcript_46347/m.91789 type:complete len:256 (+) Transcript_46347:1244-2011(+)
MVLEVHALRNGRFLVPQLGLRGVFPERVDHHRKDALHHPSRRRGALREDPGVRRRLGGRYVALERGASEKGSMPVAELLVGVETPHQRASGDRAELPRSQGTSPICAGADRNVPRGEIDLGGVEGTAAQGCRKVCAGHDFGGTGPLHHPCPRWPLPRQLGGRCGLLGHRQVPDQQTGDRGSVSCGGDSAQRRRWQSCFRSAGGHTGRKARVVPQSCSRSGAAGRHSHALPPRLHAAQAGSEYGHCNTFVGRGELE